MQALLCLQILYYVKSDKLILIGYHWKSSLTVYHCQYVIINNITKYTIKLMSTLLTSSNYIKIQLNKINTLFIKNTKTSNFSKSTPIIFKVKTNLINYVDVRPSYGVLIDNDAKKSVASLQIKYSGAIEEVVKGKLQINWIAIESSQILDKKLQHNQFTDLYKKYQSNLKEYKEYSIIIPFSLDDPANNSESKENNSQQQQPISHEKVTIPLVIQNQNQNYLEVSNKIIPAKQLMAESSAKDKTKIRISFINFMILLIFALILGIFIGSKIQQCRMTTNQQTNSEIKQQQKIVSQQLKEQSQTKINQQQEQIIVKASQDLTTEQKDAQASYKEESDREVAISQFQNYIEYLESNL